MENFEIAKNTEGKQESFRNEFRRRKKEAEEAIASGKYGDPHFKYINPDLLTGEEAELWGKMEKIKNKEDYQLLSKELNAFRERAAEAAGKDKMSDTHFNFAAYMANKMMGAIDQI